MMILKPIHQVRGYLVVNLHYDRNKFKKKRIHRLVAHAFLPNPNEYNEINHLDGDKENNRLDNLEWCTHSQNMQHAFDTCIIALEDGKVFSVDDVKMIKRLLFIDRLSNKEIAEMFATSTDYIGKIRRGDKWRRVTI